MGTSKFIKRNCAVARAYIAKSNFLFTPQDFWFTSKDNYVNAISLAQPEKNRVNIKSLLNCQKLIKALKYWEMTNL